LRFGTHDERVRKILVDDITLPIGYKEPRRPLEEMTKHYAESVAKYNSMDTTTDTRIKKDLSSIGEHIIKDPKKFA
jgi:hypothetical protein